MGPWGQRGLWGPGLLLTTPMVCFSFLAACYLFNSAREKEGSPVLRDHAHILAYSPTVCPCHLEIQNHDCLKRGKWWPHFVSSCSSPGNSVACVESTVAMGGRRWVPHGLGFFLGDFPTSSGLCSRTFFPHSPTCLCSFKEPMWCSRGRSRRLMHPTLWASVSSEQCDVSPRCLQSGRESSSEQCLQSGCSPRGPWAVPALPWCHEPLVWLRSGSPWLPGAAPGSLKSVLFQTLSCSLLLRANQSLAPGKGRKRSGTFIEHLQCTVHCLFFFG